MLPRITQDIVLPDGRTISLETGHLARQADGAVVVKYGKTMLLATVVADPTPREGADFLPLSVDYQEKFSASGRIPGGFIKRESRLNNHEILVSRLIDRVIRPLFPANYYCETQVMVNLISFEDNILPDSLAALAVSAALYISDIPFNEPISEVRVVRKNGEFLINPNYKDLHSNDLDLMVGATEADILMIEGEMKEVQERDMLEAIKHAHEAIKVQCQALRSFKAKINKPITKEFNLSVENESLKDNLRTELFEPIKGVIEQFITDKHERKTALKAVLEPVVDKFKTDPDLDLLLFDRYLKEVQKEAIREVVFEHNKRLDGRATDEIRALDIEINYLPSTHGSALFTRGETQSLSTVTLGGKDDEQMIDHATLKAADNFYLHYNFPGFSTGEVKPNRAPSRREIGHGNLAYRALKNVLVDDGKYTVRIVSDILESNGSSSMATVCAGSLALMDSGYGLKTGVSGIAMGLMSDAKTGNYMILSDILGDEDHLGDMDFKVTGTKNGLTACQMDIKIDGLSYDILSEALNQAKKGRLEILQAMTDVIDRPRQTLKPHIPRVEKIVIPKSLIGAVIGPGGKVVQKIQSDSGTSISVDEDDNNGLIFIHAPTNEALEAATELLNDIVAQPEVGEIYEGKVKKIIEFGAFVEFFRGKDGLLHVSEIADFRVQQVSDLLTEGDTITVKLINVQNGKYRLSCKDTMTFEKPDAYRPRYNDDDNYRTDKRRRGKRDGQQNKRGGSHNKKNWY